MKSDKPPRRRRVSALLPIDQYQQLEKMAKECHEPISHIVARIIQDVLPKADPGSCAQQDSLGNTEAHPEPVGI